MRALRTLQIQILLAQEYHLWYFYAMYRHDIWHWALEHYGYVTTADAKVLGIPAVELRKLASRGFLENISRGLYRCTAVATTNKDEYMEAVLWAGQGAAVSHDAVLALHQLANVNPTTLRVTIPQRVRKTKPRRDITLIQRALPAHDLTSYDGIRATTVARALLDAQALVMTTRLVEAATQARDQGLLLTDEYDQVLKKLLAR